MSQRVQPYCFVLMPFGRKSDDTGRVVDFDAVYRSIIRPSVEAADLEPIRADEEMAGGIIHKPMFERLMMCDYAVADLTTANANVFYELGVRHGVRPHSTVLMAARGMRLPFDVAPLRAIQYELSHAGKPRDPSDIAGKLTKRLRACRDPSDDSPLYQLVSDFPRPDVQRLKTDLFRESVEYSRDIKRRLERARKVGPQEIAKVERELKIVDADPAVAIDLLLSYRAVEAWEQMVTVVEKLSPPLQRTVLVREQLGFALNRLGRRDEAESVLRNLVDEFGPSSETNGILGRVYKDQWIEADTAGDPAALGYLRKAIAAYLEGFETDWRDAYPGINAVTMMEMKDPVDSRQSELLPVVRYAVRRRIEGEEPDYWDYATLLELEVLSGNPEAGMQALPEVLAAIREVWEPKATSKNLELIRVRRSLKGDDTQWIAEVQKALLSAASARETESSGD